MWDFFTSCCLPGMSRFLRRQCPFTHGRQEALFDVVRKREINQTQAWQRNQRKNETLRLNLKKISLYEMSDFNEQSVECFVHDHKPAQTKWRETFFLFVIALHLILLSFLITYFSIFLSVKKREQLSLIFILVLLENSREILSATVQDSTDSRCMNFFIHDQLIFIYKRRWSSFYKELTGWV